MSNNISSDIKQPGDRALASVTLLGRVVNELVARRWAAESAAHKNLQVGDRDTQRMWLARAAGLAEAVAVVQVFNEANSANVPAQRPPATDV